MISTAPLKTALVTGAAQRLGRAIASHLAARGFAIGVHYHRSAAAAAELVREIERSGGRAAALQADLSTVEGVRGLLPACRDRLGAPLCLVNNASIYEWDGFDTLTAASWDAHLAVNLRAPVFLAQAFAANIPAGTEGNVINIIDQKVLRPNPDYFSYTSSKSALWAVTQTMAQALAPAIRVNAVGPGPVFRSEQQDEGAFEREWRDTPLVRKVAPEDICAAIQLLLDTPALTGQMIAVDSGQHLAWRHGAG